MRFRPEQHLRRQSDFRAVREQGRRFNGGAFTVCCLPRAESLPAGDALARVGVVASIAAVGHAVLRNRAKRRLRELFRRHQAALPTGCDLLLTARRALVAAPFSDLEKKFLEACRHVAPRD